MNISTTCFALAALMALTGMGMGIYMGSTHDFTLAPAHAHLNLLGWVTMAIYGLYHRNHNGIGARLRWLQVAAGGLGAPAMAAGLALMLISPAGSTAATSGETAVIAGSLLAVLSMSLFIVVVLRDGLRPARRDVDAGQPDLPAFDPRSA